MNDPMVGAMLKLTHQIGDYRGASGENITKTWGETQILLAERAIAQGDLKPDLDPETIGLLLQEMTAGVHITAVGTESIDQMAVRMERMWYFLLPSIVPDEKVAYFREFAARRLRRYVP
jgi:transcription-repair coupling factor (superfamily II helicase)